MSIELAAAVCLPPPGDALLRWSVRIAFATALVATVVGYFMMWFSLGARISG